MNFNNIEETDPTAGIQKSAGIPEASLNNAANKSRTRYVFYAGEPGERNLGISQIPYRNGLTFVKRGVVTQVENFAYWDRDQDDRQGMPAQRHPDPRRANEVRQVLYAADIADFLVRLWGMCGLVDITAAVDLSGDEMARISKALIPSIPPTNRALKEMIELNSFDYESDQIEYKVAQQFLAALNAAEYYGRVSLAGKKSEMEMHRVGKDGIAALDDAAKRWCKVLELSVADYEVDSQSFQQAVQQMQMGAQNQQPIVIQQAPTDPNVLAAAVMAAMNHIKAQQESAALTPPVEANLPIVDAFKSEADKKKVK